MSAPTLANNADNHQVSQMMPSMRYPDKPTVYELDDCTFTFAGRTIPGKRLAELLGLIELPDCQESPRVVGVAVH